MSCATAVANRSPSTRAGRVPSTAPFYLQASITVSFLAGSSAPTPLYPLYQAAWGFSPITITVVFGIYALALLGALLIGGRLSDHVGRRPVLIAATAVQAVTMLVFATADGLSGLLVARVLQGLATGVAVAAVGAGMLDVDKSRGTIGNAVAPPIGTALGAVAAGLMVHYLPSPTHLVYLVLGVVYVLQGLGVVLMPESNARRPGALASLRPRFGLPASTRDAMRIAAPVLVAAWALAGFYGSMGPAVIRNVFGLDSSLLGGFALFVLAGSGAISILLMQRQDPRQMMTIGASALLAGVAVAVTALTYRSPEAFFLATAIAGLGFGAGFQGAVRTIMPLAMPAERAGVLSVIFVVSYLAMGVPAVVAGFFVARHGNVLATARTFGALVMVLAAIALLGGMTRPSALKTAT